MKEWCQPQYLMSKAGHRTVPVEIGRHYLAEGWGQQLMPLSDFIEKHVISSKVSPPAWLVHNLSMPISWHHSYP